LKVAIARCHIYVQCWVALNWSEADHPPKCPEDLGYQSFRSYSHLQAGQPPNEVGLWPEEGVSVRSSGKFLEAED
jgi:hypothetical protein